MSTAALCTISQLLRYQGYRFHLDGHQRTYAWRARLTEQNEEVCTLLRLLKESFLAEQAAEDVLLGTIVLVKVPNSQTEHYLVDGQQRLTTCCLIYAALCLHLGESAELIVGEEEQVQPGNLKGRLHPPNGHFLRLLNHQQRTQLAQILQAIDKPSDLRGIIQAPAVEGIDITGPDARRIVENFAITVRWLNQHLPASPMERLVAAKKLLTLMDARVKLCVITATDMAGAYQLSINTALLGLPLTETEKLRLQLASQPDPTALDVAIDLGKWDYHVNRLTNLQTQLEEQRAAGSTFTFCRLTAGEGEPLFLELLRHIKAIHSASAAFSPKDATLGHYFTSEFDMPSAAGLGFHRDPAKFLTEYLDPYGRALYRVMKPSDAVPFAAELYALQCLPQCEWRTAAVYALGMFWSRALGNTLTNDQRKEATEPLRSFLQQLQAAVVYMAMCLPARQRVRRHRRIVVMLRGNRARYPTRLDKALQSTANDMWIVCEMPNAKLWLAQNLAGAQLSVDKSVRLALARSLLLIAIGSAHVPTGPLSVELMLPASVPREWLQRSVSQPGFTAEEAQAWKSTLGNLFLVPGKAPCPLSSKSYKDKQQVLKECFPEAAWQTAISQPEPATWDAPSVKARALAIMEQLRVKWRLCAADQLAVELGSTAPAPALGITVVSGPRRPVISPDAAEQKGTRESMDGGEESTSGRPMHAFPVQTSPEDESDDEDDLHAADGAPEDKQQAAADMGKQVIKPIYRAVASCKNAIYLPAEVRDALVAEMAGCAITWRGSFSGSSFQQLGYEIQVGDWVEDVFMCLSTNGQTHARAVKGSNAGTLGVKQLSARDFDPELDADLSDKMQKLMNRSIEAARGKGVWHQWSTKAFNDVFAAYKLKCDLRKLTSGRLRVVASLEKP